MTKTNEYVVTDVAEEILATYNLCLVGPRTAWESDIPEDFPSWLREAEENISDLLPAGFRVVVREWNDEEETL